MTEAARERHIPRPIDQVWAALGDFDAIARWAPDVDHSCLMTDQQTGVGTARRVQVGRMTLVERVTAWEGQPTYSLTYDIDGLPPALGRVANRWSLAQVGSGTTATLTARVEGGPRPPQQVVARIAAARLAKANESMLAGLDRFITTSTEVPA